jgi:hypothetical protein
MSNALGSLTPDLGFWVKPKGTTWFSHFLFTEFDDKRWVENFCMAKATIFHIVADLKPIIGK